MTVLRSLLFAAIFYPGTVLYVLAGIFAMLFGRRPTLAIVLGWMDFNGWLCRHLLGIRTQIVGNRPLPPSQRTGSGYLRGVHVGRQTRFEFLVGEIVTLMYRLCT
jgi:hypothetical protein